MKEALLYLDRVAQNYPGGIPTSLLQRSRHTQKRVTPRVVFVGDSGAIKADSPFDGAIGALFDGMVTKGLGLMREQVALLNSDDPDLVAKITENAPEFLVALGAQCAKGLIDKSQFSKIENGDWLLFQSVPLLITIDLKQVIGEPERKKVLWRDLKSLLERLK